MESIADPWLIAAAKAYDYTIITLEASAGPITTSSSKPKIPTVGAALGVRCENLFYFMRQVITLSNSEVNSAIASELKVLN